MSQETTTKTVDQNNTPEIVAYLFNDKDHTGKWVSRILDFHPREIENNDTFRNVVRLTYREEAEYDDTFQVATEYTYERTLTDGVNEGIDIGVITKDTMEEVIKARALVPIKADSDVDFTPEPVRQGSDHAYFRNDNVDDEVYYRVSRRDNSAQRLVVKGDAYDIHPDQIIREIWLLENQGGVTEVSYQETPFSNPGKRCFDDTPFDLPDNGIITPHK